MDIHASITKKDVLIEKLTFTHNNIILSSYLTITISTITLIISLFIFIPQE
jgi:NADH-ubiquinone oxidoreductase chain 2